MLESHEIGLIAAGGIALIVCCCVSALMVALWFVCCRKREQSKAVQKVVQTYNLDGVDLALKMDSLRLNREDIARFDVDETLFHIKYEDLEVKWKIGSGGASAVVFYATWKGSPVAFKCFKTAEVCGGERQFAEFEKEASLLISLAHPHIISVYGCTLNPPRVGIVMEYCENGDLRNYICNHQETSQAIRLCWLADTASAIEHVHSIAVIHRDVKPDNVFLDAELTAKLADFGLGRSFQVDDLETCAKTMFVGTSGYIAPEVISGTDYTESCDVFSFGVLAYTVLTGEFSPYGGTANVDYRVATDPTFRPDLGAGGVPDGLKALLAECWEHNVADRPTMHCVVRELSEFSE